MMLGRRTFDADVTLAALARETRDANADPLALTRITTIVPLFPRRLTEEQKHFASRFVTKGAHTLVIVRGSRSEHVVFILLYERLFAVVRLPCSTEITAACEFDYRSRAYRIRRPETDAQWFADRLSAV